METALLYVFNVNLLDDFLDVPVVDWFAQNLVEALRQYILRSYIFISIENNYTSKCRLSFRRRTFWASYYFVRTPLSSEWLRSRPFQAK